jgi:glycosyltransferase involved in cell wall biosynthesis
MDNNQSTKYNLQNTSNLKDLKVAIVCDWLTSIGGAERVVLEIHKLFPDAPIYTSQYNPAKFDCFKNADIRTTWLQKLPKNNTFRKFLPILRRFAFEGLDLREYDLVISSSGAEAKAVKKLKPGAIHICYCHSPTHYYWSRYNEYMKNPGFGWLNPLAKLGLKVLVKPMRKWDYKAAQRPDYLIGNSKHIVKMIKKYYNRESTVIHPPVDTARFQTPKSVTSRTPNSELRTPKAGFVITGRQVPYRRIDLVISACNQLKMSLKIIGNGPEHNNLAKMAGPTVQFFTNVSDAQMVDYFNSSEAFIFPAVEDFGIAPVEAMAAGLPVIAYQAGGALDYVVPNKTGLFFKEQTVDSLVDTLKKFDVCKFEPADCVAKAGEFSQQNFAKKMIKFMEEKCAEL